jgi:hypothetical protein
MASQVYVGLYREAVTGLSPLAECTLQADSISLQTQFGNVPTKFRFLRGDADAHELARI